MKKKARGTRARTAARVVERSQQKVANLRHKLAELEPGGSAALAIEVTSASVIEPRAESLPCLRCGESMRVASHESSGEGLRQVKLVCRACGGERAAHFRIAPVLPN